MVMDSLKLLFNRDRKEAPRSLPGFGSFSEASIRHPDRNEDAHFVSRRGGGVFDGVTGNPPTNRGDEASKTAQTIIEQAIESVPQVVTTGQVREILRSAFRSADRQVLSDKRTKLDSNAHYGTTATCFVEYDHPTEGAKLEVAHAGDSRLYVLRNNLLESVTVDQIAALHNVPDARARKIQGQLDESDNPRQLLEESGLESRNQIYSFIGSGQAASDMAFYSPDIEGVSHVLVVSDAISNTLKFSEIQLCLISCIRRNMAPADICKTLVEMAKSVRGPRAKVDDMTAVLKSVAINSKAENHDQGHDYSRQVSSARTLRELALLVKQMARTKAVDSRMVEVFNRLSVGQAVPEKVITSKFGIRDKAKSLAPHLVQS